MTVPPSPSEVDRSQSPPREQHVPAWKRFASVLFTHNPFYLLSVSFVLHGTALWARDGDWTTFTPWPVLGLVLGYILLLAGSSFVIVRFGNVWDDARSILLMIPLLFVELSLTFDQPMIRAPNTGIALVCGGLIVSLAVSEFLLRGLRIRLSRLYRLPFYGLLALMFLYPLWLMPGAGVTSGEPLSWRIFFFSTCGGALLLTLLPAIRRGPNHVRDNGTPWSWPWFPWSLFVVMILCIGLRAYALSLSFDPVLSLGLDAALRLESTFGWYFFVPLGFSIAVLMLESGLAAEGRLARRWALVIPLGCLAMAIPAKFGSEPYAEFMETFIARVASPLWLTALLMTAFYAWAWCRGVREAEAYLVGTLAATIFIGPKTIGLSTLVGPQNWPLAGLALIEAGFGFRRGSAVRVFGSSVCVILLLRQLYLGETVPLLRNGVPLAMGVASALVVTMFFQDAFTRFVRRWGAPILVVATAAGWGYLEFLDVAAPSWFPLMFPALMTGLTLAYAYVTAWRRYLVAGICNLGIGVVVGTWHLLRSFQDGVAGKGAQSFVIGGFWLVVAFLISSWKAGWLERMLSRWKQPEG